MIHGGSAGIIAKNMWRDNSAFPEARARLHSRLVEVNAVREVSYFALKSTEFIIVRRWFEYV